MKKKIVLLLVMILYLTACGPGPGGELADKGEAQNNSSNDQNIGGESSSSSNESTSGGTTSGDDLTVNWATHLTVTYTDEYIIVQSNGLPNHDTGTFPTTEDTNNDGRPDNPNSISEQNFEFLIPLNPVYVGTPTETGMGAIGISLSGAVFYNADTAEGTFAVETEVFDACHGHPDQQGIYHYHQETTCISGNVFGYAFDGFQVRMKTEADGSTPTGLDQCNGHEHDGEYHYHLTNDPSKPIIGCYMGEVEASNIMVPNGGGGQGQGKGNDKGGGP